jgi:hypothetical protein
MLTEHRGALIWMRGDWHGDKAEPLEARSPIRRGRHCPSPELADELRAVLGWPHAREIDLGLELERLGTVVLSSPSCSNSYLPCKTQGGYHSMGM